MKRLQFITMILTCVLVVCWGCSDTIHQGQSTGQREAFESVAAFGTGASLSMDWGDYDNDGDLDLAVGNRGQNFLYTNDGNANFTESAEFGDGRRSLVRWADTDGDSDLDMIIGDDNSTSLYVNENGVFTELGPSGGVFAAGAGPSSADILGIEVGDLDGDGDVDIVFSIDTGGQAVVRNEGGNSFVQDTTLAAGGVAALADVDGDLDLDIVAGGYTGLVLKNDGNGFFTEFSTFGENVDKWTPSVADYDGDGDVDLVFGVDDGGGDNLPPLWLYDNDGNGNFEVETALAVATIFSAPQWGDLDGDGDPDLVMVSFGMLDDRVVVYVNEGGTFSKHILDPGDITVELPIENSVFEVALGDADNDGDLDIAVARFRWVNEFVFEPAQNTLFINDGIE